MPAPKKKKAKTTTKSIGLGLNEELLLANSYYFAKESGFTEEDRELIEAFEKMVASFEQRYKQTDFKHAKAAKKLKMSVITFWRRLKSGQWKKKEQILAMIRLLHIDSNEKALL